MLVENKKENVELGISSRDFPMGMRQPPSRLLTEYEIADLKADIKAIDADESVFIFNSKKTAGTGYGESDDKVHIRGNVLPDPTSTHPRDLMSARAVLTHEYYGHRPYRGLYLKQMETGKEYPEWIDEFRAGYIAARNSPGLTDEDRQYLILDALERAKETGVAIRHNGFIREVLHGLRNDD